MSSCLEWMEMGTIHLFFHVGPVARQVRNWPELKKSFVLPAAPPAASCRWPHLSGPIDRSTLFIFEQLICTIWYSVMESSLQGANERDASGIRRHA